MKRLYGSQTDKKIAGVCGGVDINSDGIVDIRDFSILRSEFGDKDAQ